MNGPQRTTLSRKELSQKQKQNKFLSIWKLHRHCEVSDNSGTIQAATISSSYSRQAVNSLARQQLFCYTVEP